MSIEQERGKLVDRFLGAALDFDFDVLQSCVSANFRIWYNALVSGGPQEMDIKHVISDVLDMERREGMKVSITDVRRHFAAANMMIQQDVATVHRADESFAFARCHVVEFEGNKIARWWEYFDRSSVLTWKPGIAQLNVMPAL